MAARHCVAVLQTAATGTVLLGDIHLLRGMERGGGSAGFPRWGEGGKEAVSRGKSVFVFTFFPS